MMMRSSTAFEYVNARSVVACHGPFLYLAPMLPYAVKSLYDRAIAMGHGRDSWTSLYEVVKR